MVAILGTVLTVIFTLVSVVLVIIVLLQSGKGAGVGIFGGGGGGQSLFGTSAPDILTRLTTIFAVLFMVIGFTLNVVSRYTEKSIIDSQHERKQKMIEKTGSSDLDVDIKNIIYGDKDSDNTLKDKEEIEKDTETEESTPVQ